MTSKVMRGRIADANRIRGLWVKSLEIAPDMSEEQRIVHIMREAVRHTPAGGYMYLESFITADPTERWFMLALNGKLDQNVNIGAITAGTEATSTTTTANRVTGTHGQAGRSDTTHR